MLLNPLPVKGYADDIAIATYNEITAQEMIHASEPIMQAANLDVKTSKCTFFMKDVLGTIAIAANMTKNQKLNKLLFRNVMKLTNI